MGEMVLAPWKYSCFPSLPKKRVPQEASNKAGGELLKGGNMKIKLLEYDAEIEWISSRQACLPWHPEDTIGVWFRFKESVASIISFAIDIEARDYTKQEFIQIIQVKGENALLDFIRKDAERREEGLKRDTKREALNKLTVDLGDKLGVPYQLNTR